MVASGNRYVSETAIEILKNGGNAYDAGVAAVMVSCLVEFFLTHFGGGAFALIDVKKSSKKSVCIKDRVIYDCFVNIPGQGMGAQAPAPGMQLPVNFGDKVQHFTIGHPTIAVPGLLKGLELIHAHHGRMPLKEVIAPAVALLKKGVPIEGKQRETLTLLQGVLTHSPDLVTMFLENQKPREKYFNAPLLNFLQELPYDGFREFYYGEIAAHNAQVVQEHGGVLTREDFENYQVFLREPLSFSLGRAQVFTNPAPSWGGQMIAKILTEFLASDPGSQKALKLAPILCKSDDWEERDLAPLASKGTTHITVMDRDANAFALTMTNGQGSGYSDSLSGVHFNNMLGEEDLMSKKKLNVGERLGSMMAPSLIEYPDQKRCVLGSGGSKRIKTAIAQVLYHKVKGECSLREAIEQHRMHYEDGILEMEPGFSAEEIKRLQEKFKVNLWSRPDLYFGGVHGVDEKTQEAWGDLRREGVGIVL